MTSNEHPAHDRNTFDGDPKLRAITEMIISQPVEQRLRQLEAEANFFLSARPLPD